MRGEEFGENKQEFGESGQGQGHETDCQPSVPYCRREYITDRSTLMTGKAEI
jgi:hypothetical protein